MSFGKDRTVATYNPDRNPDPGEWLAMNEGERIRLVESYHRRARIRLPNRRVHAVIHEVVENQLAMKVPEVVNTFERLLEEGLTRHEAIHAIGFVLAGRIHDIVNERTPSGHVDPNIDYFDELKNLTAASWRNSG